jgi:hypothetical protein
VGQDGHDATKVGGMSVKRHGFRDLPIGMVYSRQQAYIGSIEPRTTVWLEERHLVLEPGIVLAVAARPAVNY